MVQLFFLLLLPSPPSQSSIIFVSKQHCCVAIYTTSLNIYGIDSKWENYEKNECKKTKMSAMNSVASNKWKRKEEKNFHWNKTITISLGLFCSIWFSLSLYRTHRQSLYRVYLYILTLYDGVSWNYWGWIVHFSVLYHHKKGRESEE